MNITQTCHANPNMYSVHPTPGVGAWPRPHTPGYPGCGDVTATRPHPRVGCTYEFGYRIIKKNNIIFINALCKFLKGGGRLRYD